MHVSFRIYTDLLLTMNKKKFSVRKCQTASSPLTGSNMLYSHMLRWCFYAVKNCTQTEPNHGIGLELFLVSLEFRYKCWFLFGVNLLDLLNVKRGESKNNCVELKTNDLWLNILHKYNWNSLRNNGFESNVHYSARAKLSKWFTFTIGTERFVTNFKSNTQHIYIFYE